MPLQKVSNSGCLLSLSVKILHHIKSQTRIKSDVNALQRTSFVRKNIPSIGEIATQCPQLHEHLKEG
jgi:hypothetical protein